MCKDEELMIRCSYILHHNEFLSEIFLLECRYIELQNGYNLIKFEFEMSEKMNVLKVAHCVVLESSLVMCLKPAF